MVKEEAKVEEEDAHQQSFSGVPAWHSLLD